MGRLGGYEMSYPSDADVLFVYAPPDGVADGEASAAAHQIAEELRRLLGAPAPDPPLGVDADLRPEGRQGPLVRSLERVRSSTTPAGRRCGRRRRCCGPGSSAATPTSGCEFEELADGDAVPARRPDPRAGRRDPPDQGPGGDRAAAARRRPEHAHQARPRRPGRRRVGGPAAAVAARVRGAGAAPDPHPRGADRRARGRPDRQGWTRRRWPRAGRWPPGYATR